MVVGKNTKRYFRMKTVKVGMELGGGNELPGFNMRELGSMLTTENLAFDKTNVKPGQH